jgi:hypothetical protein
VPHFGFDIGEIAGSIRPKRVQCHRQAGSPGPAHHFRRLKNNLLGRSDTVGKTPNAAHACRRNPVTGCFIINQENQRQATAQPAQPTQAFGVERLDNNRRLGIGAGAVKLVFPEDVKQSPWHVKPKGSVLCRTFHFRVNPGLPTDGINHFLKCWDLLAGKLRTKPASGIKPFEFC